MSKLTNIVKLLLCLLVFAVVYSLLLSLSDYIQPNFRADFLLGRSDYFFGFYQWAFYAHIISGPLSLVVGLLLLSDSIRKKYPAFHRVVGRMQVACILLLVTPSGLHLAFHAREGIITVVGFATLSILTFVTCSLGWRAAVQKYFPEHRRWMLRCYALICSAIVIRIIGTLSNLFQLEGTYPISSWISWIIPLIAIEVVLARGKPLRRQKP